jgi:hypothetical protein
MSLSLIDYSNFNEDELLLSPSKLILNSYFEVLTQKILHNDKIAYIKCPYIKYPYNSSLIRYPIIGVPLNKDTEMWKLLSKLDKKYVTQYYKYTPIFHNYDNYPKFIKLKLKCDWENNIVYTKFFNYDNTKIDVKTIDDARKYFYKNQEFRFIMSMNINTMKRLSNEEDEEDKEDVCNQTYISLILEQVLSNKKDELHVPSGTIDIITYKELKDGDIIVDFLRTDTEYESKFNTYYLESTFDTLTKNQFTNKPINKSSIIMYICKII